MNDNGTQLGPSRHGLYVRSERGLRLRDEKVRRLLRKLRIACPWIEDSDAPIARRFCELEVLISQVYAYIRGTSVINQSGEVRNAVDAHRRLTVAQAQLADRLGLTPASRVAIRADQNAAYVEVDTISPEQVERALSMARKPVADVEVDGGDKGGTSVGLWR